MEGKRSVVGTIVLAAVLVLLLLNVVSLSRRCAPIGGPGIGTEAPDFTLPTPTGEPVKLSALRGQVVLLDFWATWCGPCLRKLPWLEQVQEALGPRGFKVLAVNVEGNAPMLQQFLQRRGGKLFALVDDGAVAAQYGVQTIPHVALVDRRGVVQHVQVGGRGTGELRAAIDRALAEPAK